MNQNNLLQPSNKISFADVAHQTLTFDLNEPCERLVLELIDSKWIQRLRNISQTGNTKLVYMFAEHSRFGHSLGVAYLATLLMKHLRSTAMHMIAPYQNAVAAAALLHDVGHVAPGSHLAERIWAPNLGGQHEKASVRIIQQDPEILNILQKFDPELPDLVCRILSEDSKLPPWTSAIISGGGWNADRGNWAIVDSAMCAVTYGRYNVTALIDAYRLSEAGELVLQESRLDALTHFFVARDSMYRQVYQHRVLQAVDALSEKIILRLRDIIENSRQKNIGRMSNNDIGCSLADKEIYYDEPMLEVLLAKNYAYDLSLESIFRMTESWWRYHLERWCMCKDPILSELSLRMRDRHLFKTIRINSGSGFSTTPQSHTPTAEDDLISKTKKIALELGLDPRYYVTIVDEADAHRAKSENPPMVLLDSGKIVPVTDVEPMIAQLISRNSKKRRWLVVPKKIKVELGHYR